MSSSPVYAGEVPAYQIAVAISSLSVFYISVFRSRARFNASESIFLCIFAKRFGRKRERKQKQNHN